jgi:hypothetical protein
MLSVEPSEFPRVRIISGAYPRTIRARKRSLKRERKRKKHKKRRKEEERKPAGSSLVLSDALIIS